MIRRLLVALGACAFVAVATANSGGYRYGVSDLGFYEPAIALTINPALFPRDRAVLAPQMRLWKGNLLFAEAARLTGGNLPALFAIVYVLTLVVLFAAAIALGRALQADAWTIAAFAALLTLRHRIARTGVNTLEGYMHPRVLAFGLGLAALAFAVRRRRAAAIGLLVLAGFVHPTMALWFAIAAAVTMAWTSVSRRALLTSVLAAAIAVPIAAWVLFPGRMVLMDAAWLSAFADRDYLFPAEWPPFAWALNLAYALVIVLIYRRRRAIGAAVAGEGALVAGLLSLVAVFLLSVPLTALKLALAVQMQINRVFWVLDAAALFYIAWWLVADVVARGGRRVRTALVAVLILAAAGRGVYLVHDKPFFRAGLEDSTWTDVMSWLRTQPVSWHVLADPAHVWRYGPSVRIAAERDTLLEGSKDPALAFYDRAVALAVADRGRALANFDALTRDDVLALSNRYSLDVFVDRATRTFDLPVVYRNADFIVYRLR